MTRTQAIARANVYLYAPRLEPKGADSRPEFADLAQQRLAYLLQLGNEQHPLPDADDLAGRWASDGSSSSPQRRAIILPEALFRALQALQRDQVPTGWLLPLGCQALERWLVVWSMGVECHQDGEKLRTASA